MWRALEAINLRFIYYFCKLHKSARTIKTFLRILWFLLAAVIVLLIAGIIAVQTPRIQTYAAERACEKFFSNVDGEVSFDKIHLRPFNTLIIRNLLIRDKNPQSPPREVLDRLGIEEYVPQDTVVTAGCIVARFTLWGLLQKQGLHLSRVKVSDGFVNLVVEDPRRCSFHRVFGIEKKDTLTPRVRSTKNIFDIRQVELENFGYSMQITRAKRPYIKEGCIDWADLEVRNVYAKAHSLKMSKGIMTGSLDACSFTEKSGYVCHNVSGRCAIGGGQSVIENIHLVDDWSDLHLHHYTMSYAQPWHFRFYFQRVRMDGRFDPSHLNMRSLGYYVQGLSGMTADLDVSGALEGHVRDFSINDLKIASRDGSFRGVLSGHFVGMPDVKNLKVDMHLDDCNSSTKGLEKFASGFTKGKKVSFGKKVPNFPAKISASVQGKLNSLDVLASIFTPAGSAEADLVVSNLTKKDREMGIDGVVRTNNLDIGRFIGNNLVHQCTMRSSLHASLRGENGPSLQIDTLKIGRLNVKGYDYSNISAMGNISGKDFDGRIISQDPNFNFLFQGRFALSPKTRNAVYRFYANIGHADLHAMNIDKREVSSLSAKTVANFTKTAAGDVLGNVTIQDVRLENEVDRYNIGDIALTSHSNDDEHRMSFSSSFAEGTFRGTAGLGQFVKDLVGLGAKEELPVLFKDPDYTRTGQEYSLRFKCIDTYDLTSFIKPGLYVDNNTNLALDISRSGDLSAKLQSHRIAIEDKYLKDLDCVLKNGDDGINGDLHFDQARLASLYFDNNDIRLLADDNNIGVGFTTGERTDDSTQGEFFARGQVDRKENGKLGFHIGVLPSGFRFNGVRWDILPSDVDICGKDISVDDMRFTSGDQGITVDGALSAERSDTLSVILDRFGLDIINDFVSNDAFDLRGRVSGEAFITSSPGNSKGVIADFSIDSTAFAGVNLGSVQASSKWDDAFKRFDVSLANTPSSFGARGSYTPSSKRIDADLVLEGFDVAVGKPFLKGVFSDMGGSVRGRAHAEGPIDAVEISSQGMMFDNTLLQVDFTNVPYICNGPFKMDSYGVTFEDVSVTDRLGGSGKAYGGLTYDHFKNIALDMSFDVNRMKCINIPASQSKGFYGNLSGSGRVGLKGPLNAIVIDVDVATDGPGQFHIPTASNGKNKSTNLLKFKEPEIVVEEDPYDKMMTHIKTGTNKKNDLQVHVKADANNQVEAFLEMDASTGSGLAGRGAGRIEVDVRPSRDIFNLKGDYTLESGNFKFVALGVATRDFTIKDGSSIKFNGAIADSDLDIDAIYKTKTSIATLISDTTSVNSRRNVECGINITDKLSQPQLGFSIDIPDLEPAVKAKVENALSTEDKVQKQFIALLLTNNFLPDESSGIVNNNAVYSNLTEIMSSQLSNILQKLNIPVDLGLSYQRNEKGKDVFDVAVSTQLFNNRVVVNGNIGNRQYKNTGTNSDFAGDIDVEIKLDKAGAFRLNVFSHSADQYTNYLDNTQRNGLGFTFQQEYNNFGYMMRHLFVNKNRKAEMEAEEDARIKAEGEKTITVTADDGKKKKDRKK